MTEPRVLFINTRSALGADVAVHYNLIQNFDKQTVQVHIAINRNATDFEKSRDILMAFPGVNLLCLDLGNELSGGGSGKLSKVISAVRTNAGALVSLAQLVLYIKKHKIDVLHTTDRPRDAAFTTLLSKLTGAKSILHLHIKWYPSIGRLTSWGMKNCASAIAISEFTKRSMVEGGVDPDRIAMIYNSSDSKLFSPDASTKGWLRKTMGVDLSTPIVGIVARIMQFKGQKELVKAFAKVRTQSPQAHLAIIGNADNLTSSGYADEVQTLVKELSLTDCITFAGWTDDIPDVMREIDILAVPSYEEPFGLVVTEAMLSGKPVVGFRSGALPEIVEEGVTGLLTPPLDEDALANALAELLNDPEKRQQMGAAARSRALSLFSPPEKAAEVVSLYKTLAEGRTTADWNRQTAD